MQRFWNSLGERLGQNARNGLLIGVILVGVLMALGVYWILRPDNQTLFSDLSAQDTTAMTAELDRMKIPYTLAESDAGGGTQILVDRNDVYKTRIKLMGKDIPLHGAVGFELFNNSDFGMTEFAQKINYQRALQGELTRTILSLAEVRDARVMLAFPEQSVFRQTSGNAKASVTLTLKPGREIDAEQVSGIQRLVAASVPGVTVQNVTIVDQSGVALTRLANETDTLSSGSGAFELKKDAESYLSRKVNDVLTKALGAGQALASVDVTLNMERVQSSIDEPVSTASRSGTAPTGVVVRERESSHGVPLPDSTHAGGDGSADLGGSGQREVEYAIGHRVEQVVSQPGSIRRMQVAVVVNAPLGADQLDHLQKIVAASVGASAERGDTVVVQTLAASAATSQTSGMPAAPDALRHDGTDATRVAAGTAVNTHRWLMANLPWVAAVLLALGVLFYVLMRQTRQPRSASRHVHAGDSLTDEQRAAALAQVRQWLRGGTPEPLQGGEAAGQSRSIGRPFLHGAMGGGGDAATRHG